MFQSVSPLCSSIHTACLSVAAHTSVSLSPGVHPILPQVLILLSFVVLFLSCAAVCGLIVCVCVHVQLLSQGGAFGYLLPIISFVLAWIETWLLDFKVLPQEAEDENSESSLFVDFIFGVRCQPGCSRPHFIASDS